MYHAECLAAFHFLAKDILVPNHVMHHHVIPVHVGYHAIYQNQIAVIHVLNLVMMVHVHQ